MPFLSIKRDDVGLISPHHLFQLFVSFTLYSSSCPGTHAATDVHYIGIIILEHLGCRLLRMPDWQMT